jgi:hypothetical protein
VFLYPWAFCVATALLVMHVQVSLMCEGLLLQMCSTASVAWVLLAWPG